MDGPTALFFIFLSIIDAKGHLDTSVTQAETCPEEKAVAIFKRWQKKKLIRHFNITCYEVDQKPQPET
jgi:hypothetical protein